MGLDQYGFAVRPHKDNTDFSVAWTDENKPENGEVQVLIAQWRKHPDLHGWMENLFNRKADEQGYAGKPDRWQEGGRSFNCQPLRLTWQDLVDLEWAITLEDLPHTEGFFFGESQPEDMDLDIAFIKAAKEAMSQDMEVYYDSWW